jgi:hypothetical protein
MSEQPRYRLTQTAYMAPVPGEMERVLPAGTEVVYEGVPGEHMEPANDAAKDIVKATPPRTLRPEMSLPLGAPGGGEAMALLRQSTGLDFGVEANVVAVVAQLLVRVGALEARLGAQPAVPAAAVAPPPPPPLKAARA